MHTAEYKYQVGQTVYQVDSDEKEIRTATVLQVTIDVYSDSRGSAAFERTYVIKLIRGMSCSSTIQVDESELFETAGEAANALVQVL